MFVYIDLISLNTSWLRWAVWPLPLGFGRNLPGRAFRQSLTKPRFRQRSTEPRFRQPLTRRAAGPHRMRPRAGPVVPMPGHEVSHLTGYPCHRLLNVLRIHFSSPRDNSPYKTEVSSNEQVGVPSVDLASAPLGVQVTAAGNECCRAAFGAKLAIAGSALMRLPIFSIQSVHRPTVGDRIR